MAEEPTLDLKDIFTKIYLDGTWGNGDPSIPLYSGPGSHDPEIVSIYTSSVRGFLQKNLHFPISIVDIGCGDFNIGKNFLDISSSYIACDVVEKIIEQNSATYQHPNLEFKVMDACRQSPPIADVIFLRQVLQHLSNDNIKKLLHNIAGKSKYLIVTEHIPEDPNFTPNVDKQDDWWIRLENRSGVRLTADPFNLVVATEATLASIPQFGGLIETRVYGF